MPGSLKNSSSARIPNFFRGEREGYFSLWKLSYLGINLGRGWNPNLEGSYFLGYSESQAKFWKQCKSRFYFCPVKVFIPDPSAIPRYSECTKTYQFYHFRVFPARGQTRFWISQPKVLIQVSKLLFLWGDKSYSRITQKFLLSRNP